MLDFSVSVGPLLAIAAANFFLSWVYYSPMVPWFKVWAKAVGMDPNQTEMGEDAKKAMPRLMIGAVAASFLLAYGLQVIVHSLHFTDFAAGSILGAVLWFFFSIPHSLNSQFEGRRPVVLVINEIWYVLTWAGFGGVVAIWR